MNGIENNPLVSVAVITYNSSSTVIETLDSIAAQTYQNLELIVSDDCSSDNTVKIVEAWIQDHKKRFVRSEIVTVKNNTGVAGNYNRANNVCNARWIKNIDGDDVLLPNCVEQYVKYIQCHPDTVYLFGKVEVFGEDEEIISGFRDRIFDYSFFELSIQEQYRWLITKGTQPIPSVTEFYDKYATDKLGIIYDEKIPMMEDWPRWIQCVKKNVRFAFIDEVVAKYRVCENSICSGQKYRKKFSYSGAMMYLLYQHNDYIKYVGLRKAMQRYISCKSCVGNNPIWKFLDALIHVLYQPYKIVKYISKK